MLRQLIPALVVLVGTLQTGNVFAHFLFIRIGEHAEAGRTVEVFFSERAEAGDPRFVKKIAHTKLSVQSSPGKIRKLTVRKGADRLRAFLPASGPVSVTGECEYGVLKRDVPFLLQYYPKAIAGDPSALNAMKPQVKIPLEIVATVEQNTITLVALHNGKPVPNAVFTTIDDDLVNEELTADKLGKATWKPSGPGYFSVYTKMVVPKTGEHKGESYSEIRQFATLAFRWPLAKNGADSQAVEMFEKALASRAVWSKFPGFSADVSGSVDGREFEGSVRINADGTAKLELSDELADDWVRDQMQSMVMHRKESSRRGRPVLRFADDDKDHPLGRLLTFVGGQFAASYRVIDDQIMVVNRNLGVENMTITALDNEQNKDGKFLPRSYIVQYWDAENGQLLKTRAFQNRWVRIGGFDLPAKLTVGTASASGFSVRSMTLSAQRLLTEK